MDPLGPADSASNVGGPPARDPLVRSRRRGSSNLGLGLSTSRQAVSSALGNALESSSAVASDNVNLAVQKLLVAKKAGNLPHTLAKLFDLPKTETIYDDFSCTYNVMSGRIFLSQNYICFYSTLLGKTTKLNIPLEKVTKLYKSTSKF